MPTKEYLEYRKEFWNCLLWTIIGLGVPAVIAFKYWKPKMDAEKAKFAPNPD